MKAKIYRYTLRKEYFGGIIHDTKTLNIEILTKDEYTFIASIVKGLKIKKNLGEKLATTKVKQFINKGYIITNKKGRLEAPEMRSIKPPKKINEGMLTAPIRIFDSYTRRCNFNCDQCYFSSSAFVTEVRRTIDETKKIIKKFYDSGTMEWRFTGGEALIIPDLFEAIKEAKKYGMNVGIYSNGWWVESIAQKVFDSGIDEIAISLEGRPEINDKRRRKGGYDRAIQTFERIYKFNKKNPNKSIKVIIATAVGKDNLKDVPFLVDLVAKYGFNINFIPLKPSGRARYTLTDEMLNPVEYKEFAKIVQNLRKNVKKSGIKISLKYKDLYCPTYEDKSNKPFPFNYAECGALTTYLSMLPNGQVFSCPFILDVDSEGKYMGPNMINFSVDEAWNHPNFERYRNAEKVGCTDCKFYMNQCRGKCRATVLGFGGKIEDGKLIGDDPQCFAQLI